HLLSFLFVASHFPLIRKLDLQGHSKFLKHYFISMAARFLAVLACFAAVLLYVHIDQILFTVSFIISYIFHSIIEMILFNKILENRHVNR
ncbi:MAG: hypothetical protein R3350_07960, partial [Saprospiraceae bacterium]|nr:hypothetical protein [Saprospiraceae bacterium]